MKYFQKLVPSKFPTNQIKFEPGKYMLFGQTHHLVVAVFVIMEIGKDVDDNTKRCQHLLKYFMKADKSKSF